MDVGNKWATSRMLRWSGKKSWQIYPAQIKKSHFGYVKDGLLHDQGELMSIAVDICLLRIIDYFILDTDNIQ